MANGNDTLIVAQTSLPVGAVRTSSGRISAATSRGNTPIVAPFSTAELVKLDDTLLWASQRVRVRFSVYIGDLIGKCDIAAAKVFAHAPEPENGCLIAVSPNSHDVVILSGINVSDRITSEVAALAASSVISTIKEGNLIDAIIAAMRAIVSAIKNA